MKRQWITKQRLRCMAGAATCLLFGTGQAISQNDGSNARDQQGRNVQTSDGVLSISASVPSQVRTDEQFEYQVTVTNTTDQMVLHDIKLKHQSDQGISIESVKLDGKSDNKNSQANRKDKQQDKQQNQQQDKQAQANANKTLTIDMLQPGESKTLQITGSADQEGRAKACLMVMSYRPAICLQTNVVQPELKITKSSPDRVNQCDVIELVYTVTNDGSGPVGTFEIVDELADGIKTIDGNNRLAFEVDQLKSGDTRRFVARVFATKTGEFKSRAMAQANESDLKSRSKNVGPNVVGADIQVRVDSNRAVYSRRPAMFTAMVTNNGNAPAENVNVDVHWPEEARLIRITQPEMTDQSQSEGSNDSYASDSSTRQARNNAQDKDDSQSQNRDNKSVSERNSKDDNDARSNTNTNKRANRQANRPADQQDQQDSRKQLASGSPQRQMMIDRLEPGQTAKFTYTLSAREADEIPTRVEAVYTCTVDEAHDNADAETRKTSQAMASVQVIRLPALQIYAVDDADPVPMNQKVTYTIRLKNEGDARDENVKITAKIPNELKFVSADGPTEFEQIGNEVTFEPIESLSAGDEVEYTLTARAMNDGNVKLQVELESEALSSTIQAEEPTQLFNAQASN